MPVELTDLKIFVSIVEEGDITSCSGKSGPLAIGVVETVTCGNFAEFQSQYPEVILSIVTGNTDRSSLQRGW